MRIRTLPLAAGLCCGWLSLAVSPGSAEPPPGPVLSAAAPTSARDLAGRRPFAGGPSLWQAPQPQGDTPADWHALGPFGGDVADVAASPTAPQVVLAGIAPNGGSGGTLYRSSDGGANWARVAALGGRSVYDIEFDATGKVYLATDSGVMASTDDGMTWIPRDLGIGLNQGVYDVAVDPSNASVIWAAVADAFGQQPANLVRSGDGGVTWTDVTPPHAAPMNGMGIAIDPSHSDTVIAVFGGSFGGGEVWVTTNGGASWVDRSAGLPANPMRAVVYDGSRLLVGGGQLFGSQFVGLYRSTDLGANWTRLDDASWPLRVVSDIAVDPNAPQTILVSTDGAGVNRSSDGGATWQTRLGGSGALSTQSLRFRPGSSSQLLLGASSLGVYRSDDGGAAFVPASNGIGELPLFSIDTSPTDANHVAAAFQGNNNGGVFTSADGGVTWLAEPVPPTRYSKVAFAPDGTLYAMSSGPSSIAPEGLYRRNGDGSWSSLGPDQGPLFESDLAPIRFSASDPHLIFVGGSDFGVAGDQSTIWRSTDAGQTWTKQYLGGHNARMSDIEIVGAGPNLVAVYDGFDAAQAGGAVRSSDGGVSWTPALSGLPAFARFPRLCTSAADPTAVYMSMWDTWGSGAVYRSDDNGGVWASTGWSGGTTIDIACDQDDAQVLYVAQSGADKVVRSHDQGATFSAFASGLDAAGEAMELALSRSGAPRLYLAAAHGGFVTARSGPDDTIFANGFD